MIIGCSNKENEILTNYYDIYEITHIKICPGYGLGRALCFARAKGSTSLSLKQGKHFAAIIPRGTLCWAQAKESNFASLVRRGELTLLVPKLTSLHWAHDKW